MKMNKHVKVDYIRAPKNSAGLVCKKKQLVKYCDYNALQFINI